MPARPPSRPSDSCNRFSILMRQQLGEDLIRSPHQPVGVEAGASTISQGDSPEKASLGLRASSMDQLTAPSRDARRWLTKRWQGKSTPRVGFHGCSPFALTSSPADSSSRSLSVGRLGHATMGAARAPVHGAQHPQLRQIQVGGARTPRCASSRSEVRRAWRPAHARSNSSCRRRSRAKRRRRPSSTPSRRGTEAFPYGTRA